MNGGRIAQAAPGPHRCRFYVHADGPVGTVWECPECGTYWRHEPISLLAPPGWYVLSGLRLWWWKRRQRRRRR